MRSVTIATFLCLSALCLSGCGGGGTSSGGSGGANVAGGGGNVAGGGSTSSKYAGKYVGTYENGTTGTIGQFSFTVGSTGTISNGTIAINGTNETLTGSISNSGAATFISGGNTPTATGTMSAAGAPTVFATLKNTDNQTVWVVALLNPSGPAAGGNSFSNDYTGSTRNNTVGLTGILSFSVNGSGSLSGTTLIDEAGTIEFAAMSGSVSSSGALTYTITSNGVLITTTKGQLALANSSLTSSLKNTLGDSLTLDVQAVD